MHLMGCIKIQGLTVITQACALTSFDVCAHQSGPAKAAMAQRADAGHATCSHGSILQQGQLLPRCGESQ